ncbi:SRPBCC family protein [Nocardia sp. CA-128927]|uniref:SRPBCC family protein n=1 Tax=Nocardia sp. CA-128927 TaxID=3239975 RepID=UPI003D9617A4
MGESIGEGFTMETVTIERVIAAPAKDVFEWLADASNYPRATRVVLRQQLTTPGEDAPYGRNAVRQLLWVVGWFRERITSYDPPYEFGYLVERSFPPSRHEGGKLAFTEVSGGTRVVWTTTAEVRLPFAATLTRLLMKPGVTYIFGKVLDAAAAELTKASS